ENGASPLARMTTGVRRRAEHFFAEINDPDVFDLICESYRVHNEMLHNTEATKDRDLDTALHVAARCNNIHATRAMLKVWYLYPALLGARNRAGYSALCIAMNKGHTEVATTLLDADGLHYFTDRFEGTFPGTPLGRALWARDVAMAERHGFRVVVIDVFDGGMTDEQLAARNRHGVPVEAIAGMRKRWEADWRAAAHRPQWWRRNR
ncbi:MAG: ankyrin repeat domain-containing protein, partial [Bacteroidetes bacterium]|nr:ankyrin repeat domain-containing protein [Bacteroidota bacterium]